MFTIINPSNNEQFLQVKYRYKNISHFVLALWKIKMQPNCVLKAVIGFHRKLVRR